MTTSSASGIAALGAAVRIVGAVMLVLVGCSAVEEPAGRRYEVAGVVRGIEIDDGVTRLRIEHEAIPDFVDIDGNEVGMDAMTMTMTVSRDVELPDALSTGDAVRFGLDVDWTRTPTGLIVALELVGPVPSAAEGER